jgi:hypothetical protein
MPRRRPSSAKVTEIRDLDVMLHLAEAVNGSGQGIPIAEVADLLGFDDGDNRPMGIRLAWMRHYGMVAYDPDGKLWNLTRAGRRVTEAHLRAPAIKVVEAMPDEAAIELMAHVTSRFQHGQSMLATMLRREFVYGTQGPKS